MVHSMHMYGQFSIGLNVPDMNIIYLYKNASIDLLFNVYICQSLEIIITILKFILCVLKC